MQAFTQCSADRTRSYTDSTTPRLHVLAVMSYTVW